MPDYAVAGLLELLWQVAARFHDDGGIGRFTDAQLAWAIDFRGDPRHLVHALISAGWLDEAALPVRLTVHDWLTHCPNHVWDRVRKRVKRLIGKASTDEQKWLVASYERARVERNRDGGEDDGPELRDDPRRSTVEVGRPVSSGDVRQRPATAPPNPRPKTQDREPEKAAVAAFGGTASTPTTTTPDASEEIDPQGEVSPTVLTFTCVGEPPTWDLKQQDLDQLVAEKPGIDVLGELRKLAARTRAAVGQQRAAIDMPIRLVKWLEYAQNNPGLSARPTGTAVPIGPPSLRSTARQFKHDLLDGDLDGPANGQSVREVV